MAESVVGEDVTPAEVVLLTKRALDQLLQTPEATQATLDKTC